MASAQRSLLGHLSPLVQVILDTVASVQSQLLLELSG